MVDPFAVGTLGVRPVGPLVAGTLDPLPAAITALKSLILVSGGAITWYAYRAYRRTRAGALGALAVGFGLVTLGAFLAGVVDHFLPLSRDVALVVESGFTAGGFAVVLWSLFRR